MDRIRQALDRMREERTRTQTPPAPTRPRSSAARAAGSPYVYTRTRVFTPAADALEANRILSPLSPSPAASAIRLLRTQVLQRLDAHEWHSLAIFSPTAGDGKTTAAINLAISLANDQSHSVLLVDFDLRNPTIASRIGFAPEFGGDDVLTGQASVEDCLYHPAGFDRLVILPARRVMPNSSELLAGPACRELVSELRNRYPERVVLFDLPPVLGADDALAFAPLVECGLVIAAESHTRRNDLTRTIELLHKTPLIGTVLNRAVDVRGSY